MKKRRIIYLVVCIIMLVIATGCNGNNYQSVFDIADYSDFNSDKYGLSGITSDDKKPLKDKKVSLSGEVIEIEKPSYMDYLCIKVKDINKDEWLIEVTALDDDEQYSVEFDVGRIISVDGVFIGKSFWYDIPAIMMDRLYANNKYYYPEDFVINASETVAHVGLETTQADPPTEAPTEEPTEAIINNTSSNGFYASGRGDYVATGLTVTGYAVLHIEYTGDRHFSVVSYEGDDYDDLLVNTTGYYVGDVLIDHTGNFDLEINATGEWSITSSGLEIDDTTSFAGHGDAVTGITSSSGGIWEITHNGNRHFSVVEYGLKLGYMDLLANTTGEYTGTVKVDTGDNIFFEVNADGDWTIKKKD